MPDSPEIEAIALDPDEPVGEFLLGVMEIVQDEKLDSPDQMEAAVGRLLARRAPVPRTLGVPVEDQAGEMAAIAWTLDDPLEGMALALEAVRLWPDCADGYTLLGLHTSADLVLAIPLFTFAVMAGVRALGSVKLEQHTGDLWALDEAHPFLNALGFLARSQREAGALGAAAIHFGEMLRLNTSDDQGARYDLLATLLEMGEHEGAGRVLEMFPEEATGAFFSYARALKLLQQRGDGDEARIAIREARTANVHAVGYLTGEKTLPLEMPESFGPGNEEEAIVLADLQGPAWAATEGAIDWLRRQTGSAPGVKDTPPAKEKRSGPREV